MPVTARQFFKRISIKTYPSQKTFDLCKKHNEKQPEFYFTKDTTFAVGNQTFKTFYPGEGHSPDNIVVWFGKQKILYGGCLVKRIENNSLGNVADANFAAWPKSIRKTMGQFPNLTFVIPGHFGWQSNKALEHTVKLLKKDRKKRSKLIFYP